MPNLDRGDFVQVEAEGKPVAYGVSLGWEYYPKLGYSRVIVHMEDESLINVKTNIVFPDKRED